MLVWFNNRTHKTVRLSFDTYLKKKKKMVPKNYSATKLKIIKSKTQKPTSRIPQLLDTFMYEFP